MQETRGELSRNTRKPQAESPTSSPGRAWGGAGGLLPERKDLDSMLKDGRDDSHSGTAHSEECVL